MKNNELIIKELWERGKSVDSIALALNIPKAEVLSVIWVLTTGQGDDIIGTVEREEIENA